MDWGDAASVTSALVALAALTRTWYVGRRQIRIAEEARDDAQAALATSRTQTAMVVETTRIALEQHEQGNRPDFNLRPHEPANGSWTIDVEMTTGPTIVMVECYWLGETMGEAENGNLHGFPIGGRLPNDVQAVQGTSFQVEVEVAARLVYTELRLILHSYEPDEQDGPRTPWVREIHWRRSTPE